MALDPLKNAMDVTSAAASKSGIPTNLADAKALGSDQLDAAGDAAQAKLDELAKYKDPELIKKEAEAKAMALVADKQQEVLAQKDEIEKQVAETITLLLTLYLAFPPKLPAIDVKALAKKAYAKTKKDLREVRQNVSKENLKKGKEKFKYPMKPKKPSIPQVPELPKLPTVPKLPTL